ncbi:hypothetical protein SHIRM173S_04474 [Streptomyces hirsutus]
MTSTEQAPRPGAGRAHPEHLGHVIFIAASAAVGGFLFGYDSSVINGVVEAIRSRYGIGSAELAQVIAIALIGCGRRRRDRGPHRGRASGRIRCMQIAATLLPPSAQHRLGPCPSPCGTVALLAHRRRLRHAAWPSVIGPAYIAEVAPPAYRGRLRLLRAGRDRSSASRDLPTGQLGSRSHAAVAASSAATCWAWTA